MFESLKKKFSGLVEKLTKKVDEKAQRELQQTGDKGAIPAEKIDTSPAQKAEVGTIFQAPKAEVPAESLQEPVIPSRQELETEPSEHVSSETYQAPKQEKAFEATPAVTEEKPLPPAKAPLPQELQKPELPEPSPPPKPIAKVQIAAPALPKPAEVAPSSPPKPKFQLQTASQKFEPQKPIEAALPKPPKPVPPHISPVETHEPFARPEKPRHSILGSIKERLSILKKRTEESPVEKEAPLPPPKPEVSVKAKPRVDVEQEPLLKKELEAPPRPVPIETSVQSAEPESPKGRSFKERIFGAVLETEISESDLGEMLSELEVDLLENDVALEVTERIISDMRSNLKGRRVRRGDVEKAIRDAIRLSLEDVLSKGKSIDLLEEIRKAEKPYKMVFVGINGTGKTTTIAKVANLCLQNGFEPVIAASDTFRAASIEQLEAHAQKLGVKLVKHKYGADAAAVAFDAIEHAKAKSKPVVLIDTAGRMQTNANLMDELRKIIRVVQPDLVVFVGDSLTGNDAVEQARTFNEVRVDAVILTKSDADAKGGACLSISYAIGKPVLYLGTGQNYSDLVRFTPEWFMEKVGA